MRRINRCLNTRLIEICKRAIQLDELNEKLQAFLPHELQAHCQVGSFNRGCLIIIVDNATWASQLRYLLPDLRDKMRKAGIYQLSSIKCVVTTSNLNATIPDKHRGHTLSNHARFTILAASEQCSYPPLKNALMHLAGEDDKNSN